MEGGKKRGQRERENDKTYGENVTVKLGREYIENFCPILAIFL